MIELQLIGIVFGLGTVCWLLQLAIDIWDALECIGHLELDFNYGG